MGVHDQQAPKGKATLVGGFNPSEKYESQLGILFPIYGKIKFMFQATNQQLYMILALYWYWRY